MGRDDAGSKSGRIWLVILAVLLPVIMLSAAAYLLLFGYNRFSLELELLGGEQLAVEYGEHYSEPGCRVLLRGSLFLTSGVEVNAPVEIAGKVNGEKLGKYALDYRASYMGLEASKTRLVRVVDTICPVITLVPDAPDLQPAPFYQEAGFSAWDNYDGDITDRVVREEEEGRILYSVVDSSGNPTFLQREIPIFDQYPPELTLLGDQELLLPLGMDFVDPGFTAYDKKDGDLTSQVSVEIDHPFVRYVADTYQLTYRVCDSEGYETAVSRTLTTVPSPRPVILYPKSKTIYLTFDDGPGPDTGRLLDLLKRYNVRATFFVVDTGYPEFMRRIVNEGHSIGIHSCSHDYAHIYSSADAFFEEVFALQQLILDTTGVETWLLRFPGGSSNTISRWNHGIMTELTQAVEACGFSYFDWNVDSDDAGEAKTAGTVFQNVVDGVQENTYSVVLQHDIHSYSVDAVEEILQWGKRNGYRFLALQTDSPGFHHDLNN